jgi:1-deoxy-D-xylulose 5-phosphate reductoisomerase
VIRKTLDGHAVRSAASLEPVLEADRWARERARKYVRELER